MSFDCFEASDAAIEGMHGQYLSNRQITVSYAYKKDTKGESEGAADYMFMGVLDRCGQGLLAADDTWSGGLCCPLNVVLYLASSLCRDNRTVCGSECCICVVFVV